MKRGVSAIVIALLLIICLTACAKAEEYAVPSDREVESISLYVASSGKNVLLSGEDFEGVEAGLRRVPKLSPSSDESSNTSPNAYDYTIDVVIKKTKTKASFSYRIYIGVYSATAYTADNGEVTAGKTVLRRGEYVGTADKTLVALLADIVYRETGRK